MFYEQEMDALKRKLEQAYEDAIAADDAAMKMESEILVGTNAMLAWPAMAGARQTDWHPWLGLAWYCRSSALRWQRIPRIHRAPLCGVEPRGASPSGSLPLTTGPVGKWGRRGEGGYDHSYDCGHAHQPTQI
jgi:hypothetical protein